MLCGKVSLVGMEWGGGGGGGLLKDMYFEF